MTDAIRLGPFRPQAPSPVVWKPVTQPEVTVTGVFLDTGRPPARATPTPHVEATAPSIPRSYRWSWFVLLILAVAAGVVAGASLIGGVGLDPMNALFCVLAVFVLAGTLMLMGRDHRKIAR